MKKYILYSVISEINTSNIQKNIIGEFDDKDSAVAFMEQIYQKNKTNPDMRDVFYAGDSISMFNSSANCYSNYKLKISE